MRERHRQEREPGLDRRVAEHLLEVERDEEPHREHRRAEQQHDDVRRAQRPRASRSAAASAAPSRTGPRSRRTRAAARCPPAISASVDAEPQPVTSVRTIPSTSSDRPSGRGDRARRDRSSGALAGCGPRRCSAASTSAAISADRHVDEQDPAPAEQVGQHAAEQHAGGAAGAAHRAPDRRRRGCARRPPRTSRSGSTARRARSPRRRVPAPPAPRSACPGPVGEPAGERGERRTAAAPRRTRAGARSGPRRGRRAAGSPANVTV